MKTCEENCDASCYRCLRSFKNKFEHGLLDRHVGAELLEYLIGGEMQPFDPERIRSSTTLLLQDLERQSDDVSYPADQVIPVPGRGEVKMPIVDTRQDGTPFANQT